VRSLADRDVNRFYYGHTHTLINTFHITREHEITAELRCIAALSADSIQKQR